MKKSLTFIAAIFFIVLASADAQTNIVGVQDSYLGSALRGSSTQVAVGIRNLGALPSQPVNITLNSVHSWFSLDTPTPLPSVGAGQKEDVLVSFSSTPSTPLGLFEASLVVEEQGTGVSISIPIRVNLFSHLFGSLEVFVEDEFTYVLPGSPRVEGANVSIHELSPFGAPLLVATQFTGADGRVFFPILRSGPYLMIVEADGHLPSQQTVIVPENNQIAASAFVPRSAVTYTSTVTPTETEDENPVAIQSNFSTETYRPKLSLSPMSIDVEEIMNQNIKEMVIGIENEGLATIENLKITVIDPPGMTVTLPNNLPTNLSGLSQTNFVIQLSVDSPGEVTAGGGLVFSFESGSGNGSIESDQQFIPFVDSSSPPLPPAPPSTNTVVIDADTQQDTRFAATGISFTLATTVENSALSEADISLTYQILDDSLTDRTADFSALPVTIPTTVAAEGSESFDILLTPIPNKFDSEREYFSVETTLTFTVDGNTTSHTRRTDYIEVIPSPRLQLKAFGPLRSVSDDPLTSEVESPTPFPVGLMVTNLGTGPVRNLNLASSQPTLISAGLPFDYQQMGTALEDEAIELGLELAFGDIGPGETRVAQNILTTNISGNFDLWTVDPSVPNSAGDTVTPGALAFETTTIHDTIKIVRDPRPGALTKPAFLTDELQNGIIKPDTVHLGNGTTTTVEQQIATVTAPSSFANRFAQISLGGPGTEFVYFSLPDPSGNTMTPISLTRSDGLPIQLGENFWTTHERTSDPGDPPTYATTIHVFDHNPPAFYTLAYGNDPPVITPISDRSNLELTPFSTFAQATDPDSGSGSTIWSLDSSAPAGMTINPVSGLISWTSTETDGGQTYPITVIATDANTPFPTSSITFDLLVVEQNTAPVVGVATLNIVGGYPLSHQVQLSDADLPQQTLTCSFTNTPPDGMTITPAGLIEWAVPSATQSGQIQMKVLCNDGVSSGTGIITFNTSPFSVLSLTSTISSKPGGSLVLQYSDLPYHPTELWSSENLLFWQRVSKNLPAENGQFNYEFTPDPRIEKLFYQLRIPTN